MKILRICIVGLIFLLNGCSSADSKYPGWENVRIMNALPDARCQYVTQQVCYPRNAIEGCANFHKKKAAQNNADTVVIDQITSTGDSGILADYYQCK